MKILKSTWRFLAVVILLILLFCIIALGPVERTNVMELPVYAQMMSRLDSIIEHPIEKAAHHFAVGYSKINITPSQPTSLAGYGNRRGKLYHAVHDSIFVRSIVLDNGAQRVAIVSADLLIIPPKVTELLKASLGSTGIPMENVYLGATHTHNSIGNWGEGATGFIYGGYEDSIAQFISGKIRESIIKATSNLAQSTIRAGAIAIPEAVKNRLIDNGPEDPFLRVMEISRSDGKKILFMSFAAHATCLYSRDLQLSRDYPGTLVDSIEKNGYEFAMFMAGAVGSHRADSPEGGWTCMEWMAKTLTNQFLDHQGELKTVSDSTLYMEQVPLLLAEPQVKIGKNIKVRSWLFRSGFGDYEVYLNALRIGDIVMLGTPCDFSGELVAGLDSAAHARHLTSMVTSFNGGYIGYITPSRYFDTDHYETRLMNWYPPGNAEYLQRCLQRMIDAVAE